MENTLENKEKFFGQYLGAIVKSKRYVHFGVIIGVSKGSIFIKYTPSIEYKSGFSQKYGVYSLEDTFLQLKPISSLSIHDYNYLREKFEFNVNRYNLIDHFQENYEFQCHVFDYLKSKGYAIPYMGLSVEELINRGWIKLL